MQKRIFVYVDYEHNYCEIFNSLAEAKKYGDKRNGCSDEDWNQWQEDKDGGVWRECEVIYMKTIEC